MRREAARWRRRARRIGEDRALLLDAWLGRRLVDPAVFWARVSVEEVTRDDGGLDFDVIGERVGVLLEDHPDLARASG